MGAPAVHLTSDVDWDLVRLFHGAVRRLVPDARVLVFGSRARGTSSPTSDYDFLIISTAFAGVSPLWRGQGLARAWAALDPPVDMDVLCATPEEFEQARGRPTSWISEAAEEAIEVDGGLAPANPGPDSSANKAV